MTMRTINTTTGYLYAVRDLRLDVFQLPFAARSDDDAVRMLMQIAARSSSVAFDFPRDYVLYCIGEFDYDKASVRSYETVEHVCDMSYILRQVQAEREVNGQEKEEKIGGTDC